MIQEVERGESQLNSLVLLESEPLVDRQVAIEERRTVYVGQMMLPSCPGGGGVKQLGLKYCPEERPLRGSQVTSGTRVGALVPRSIVLEKLDGQLTCRSPLVLGGCIGAPDCTCVMPESTQPLTTLPASRIPLTGLGRLKTYAALKMCVWSQVRTP